MLRLDAVTFLSFGVKNARPEIVPIPKEVRATQPPHQPRTDLAALPKQSYKWNAITATDAIPNAR